MGVTLEVMMIGSCYLIFFIMVKRKILRFLTLEVKYCLWCLKLANIDVEFILGYLAGRAHELDFYYFEVNHR